MFSSSCQFGDVLPVVDVCPDIGVDHLVLCVRDAGEGADCQHPIHGQQFMFWWMYDMLIYVEQSIALFGMIRYVGLLFRVLRSFIQCP